MSIIPDKSLFIVTSALNSHMGVLSREERYEQTIEGLRSLREKCPEAIVLFADGSPEPVEKEKYDSLRKYVNLVADFSNAKVRTKSGAENVLMFKVLSSLKSVPEFMRLMHSVRRVYKITARTPLHTEFDLKEHDHFGKYVFKKRIPTWLSGEVSDIFTDLLITRLFSFCPSLIDDYMVVCKRNIDVIRDTGIDSEHAHFFNIEPEKLVELDKIHCQGVMASTGATEFY